MPISLAFFFFERDFLGQSSPDDAELEIYLEKQ